MILKLLWLSKIPIQNYNPIAVISCNVKKPIWSTIENRFSVPQNHKHDDGPMCFQVELQPCICICHLPHLQVSRWQHSPSICLLHFLQHSLYGLQPLKTYGHSQVLSLSALLSAINSNLWKSLDLTTSH